MNPDKEIAPPFKMLKTKVLIIGGGPAGATAARYLSEAGIDTILAERDFSYTKPCAGAITVSGFHEFRLPDYLIQNRIHKVAVVLPSDKAIELKKDLCITDRCMLNQAMQSMAADKGTSLIEARFIGFGDRNSTTTNSLVKRKDDGIVVEIKSDYVLACDGVSFTVGRKCGIQTPARVYSISVQMHSFHGDACEFWLGSEYAGGKYCSWVFPTGEGASIGTGSDRSRELHDILDVFMKRRFGRSAKHLLEENLIGKTRIFPLPVWKGDIYRSNNIFFLGDAAGMVMPISGEGIYYAMKSGQYAARAIIEKKPDLYRQLWENEFKHEFTVMNELNANVFKGDDTIEKFTAFYKRGRRKAVGGAKTDPLAHNVQDSNIQFNKMKTSTIENIKNSIPKASEAKDATVREITQLFVFMQRQPENPQKLLQQLIDQQRDHGYHISTAVTARVGVVKDVNDKKLIGASLMQAFPDADIKDLFEKTAIQSFRLPDGNEGKCCVVYDFPSGKPATHKDVSDAPIMAFNDIMLIITEACNFRCSYCYENGKSYNAGNKMSLSTAKKAVDILFSQTPANMKRTCLNFFGGEPALEFDLIKKVVEYSWGHRTIGGYKGDKYNYVINTNGAILTDEMFEFYSRLGKKINIRVSVDGYGDNHDRTRKMADGRGTWRLLDKTLPRFRDLKGRYGVRVNLVSTINKSTFRDIYYNYKHLYELTGMQIAFLFVHEEKWNEEDYKTIKEQVMLLYDDSVKYKIQFPLSSVQTQQELANLNDAGLFQKICNAGIRSFTVNHGGDIFSCHRAYYYGLDDVFKMGNTETGFIAPSRSLMYRINNLKRLPQKCQDCNPGLRNKCHICMASNKKAYGDFYRASDGYCTLMKELYDDILARERQRQQCD